jgi:hypothetical protein
MIETVMPDASGFWVAAYGADSRVYLSRGEPGLYVRTLEPVGQAEIL